MVVTTSWIGLGEATYLGSGKGPKCKNQCGNMRLIYLKATRWRLEWLQQNTPLLDVYRKTAFSLWKYFIAEFMGSVTNFGSYWIKRLSLLVYIGNTRFQNWKLCVVSKPIYEVMNHKWLANEQSQSGLPFLVSSYFFAKHAHFEASEKVDIKQWVT